MRLLPSAAQIPRTDCSRAFLIAILPLCCFAFGSAKSEGIAYAEEGRELLKDSAGGPVCGGHDLPPGKRSKVVPEIAPQDNVLVEPKLDPATQADHGFPFIDRDEARDVRQRLGGRVEP